MINFTFAPKNAHPFTMGRHFNFKRANIWVDNIWNYEAWCNDKFNLVRDLEEVMINRINSVIAHELMHILCKTNNEEFIMAIPKTHDAIQWDEPSILCADFRRDE